MKKVLEPTNEICLKFSDEEIQELGLEINQKYDVKLNDDGSIKLTPWTKIDLGIDEWPRELLLMLIKESLDQDIPVNDVINTLLKESLAKYDTEDECCGKHCCDSSEQSLESEFGYTENEAVLPTAYNDYTTASHDAKLSTVSNYSLNNNTSGGYSYVVPDTPNTDTSIVNDILYRS
jgi:hypothetical protein